ncbi:hypothetical protein A0H81_00772 [Grifola frondosa]|uniref:DUF7923 domain-containing protein n=1 Tax=Grifola frondosa TaxID=5627 RepID=A0A1C7MS95_GRIFR|nr:hypothetical protein A0H81_00772 [Grifola frondosa]
MCRVVTHTALFVRGGHSTCPSQSEKAMDERNVVSDLETWDRLLSEQTVLFRKTAAENAELKARVEELERELSVWKSALKAADEEKTMLSRTALRLERNMGSLREDNPLILCLIDGDGNIFSSDLITMGQAGRQAAMLLTKGLTDHLASIDPADVSTPSRGQVWLTIYCNKSGLLDTLINNEICTAEEFEAFVLGFNQASPLFSIVDAGSGKEAADSKIKECLRVFTRFPQTSRVFFGGAHDNGYTSTLNYLQNEGLLDKVTLLRGYKDLAYEIKNLNLPFLEIEGIFMPRKLQSSPFKRSNNNIDIQGQVSDFDNLRNNGNSRGRTQVPAKPRRLDPNLNCRYAHDYVPTTEQLNELRINAKMWPCPFVNQGYPCFLEMVVAIAMFVPEVQVVSSSSKANASSSGNSCTVRSLSPRGGSRICLSATTTSSGSQALSSTVWEA